MGAVGFGHQRFRFRVRVLGFRSGMFKLGSSGGSWSMELLTLEYWFRARGVGVYGFECFTFRRGAVSATLRSVNAKMQGHIGTPTQAYKYLTQFLGHK